MQTRNQKIKFQRIENHLQIYSSIWFKLFFRLSIGLYRDAELKKISLQASKQQKIDECITKVQARYGKVTQQGAGILNREEILTLKKK